MLSLSGTSKIFLCRAPVDFRKAHDGLLAIVRDMLERVQASRKKGHRLSFFLLS